MTFTRPLTAAAVAAVAAGIALTGAFGVGIAAAQVPSPAPLSPSHDNPDPQLPPGVKLDHHDKRQLKKYLKEHPEAIPPGYGQR
ncbi:hypothetical protein KIH27_01125 [Mycobacterium sp. M1]|uniref:Secreted protein n=1 Tax=Mycolicibacter acidiphilus TaxID=2835306 RepID=A0ABS5RD34_9MYCO|nr:hypothetical protein [Mycolicibacter acidiphilus]MBS9532185.1 hypothetical protein [Mycolicibacter acidiphilus]